MTAITAILSVPFATRLPILLRFRRALALGTGLLSLGFGLYLAVHVGFVDGLLLGRSRTPHGTHLLSLPPPAGHATSQ
jgi:hypothetical protein